MARKFGSGQEYLFPLRGGLSGWLMSVVNFQREHLEAPKRIFFSPLRPPPFRDSAVDQPLGRGKMGAAEQMFLL